ncbi:MAG: M6 family metalloprotease domain-containing protein [Bacteroidales bacterium]|nr:M6 family metalloprotease domain-containing protein [Bacteroidales bacterium]
MKKTFAFLLSCMLATAASAMPARPGTFTVTQSDGTVLTLRLVGDEHFHYFLDVNTGAKMLQAANGDYTVMPETEFVRRQAAAKTRLMEANATRMARMERYQQQGTLTNTTRGSRVGTFNGQLSGQKKGLVILANFADLDHALDDPQLAWDRAFNEVGYSENGHVGSVHDYFYDQSYGMFDLEFDVVGPVTVSKKMSYYGQNNSYGSDAHAAEMVAEACKLVNNQVDFKDYDWDGDGEVDQVYVIYAGYGESNGAPAETIWPHEYWLEYGYGSKLYLDGVYINTYACSCELRGNGRGFVVQNGIGTACHEFSHCIGYPDFYDVDYGGCFGMDEWDVMGSGGYNGPSGACEVPAGFTAYERWMGGWLEPIEFTEGTEVKDMPCLLDEPVAYIMQSKAKGTMAKPVNEYFLLENRQNKKWFSYPSGAHGMLVTHVDYNKSAWASNTVNTVANTQRMTIIPAGKTFGSYNSSYKSWYPTAEEYRSMLFPGTKKVTELTNESHYDVGGKLHNRNTDGTYNMNIPLTEITEKDGMLSFLVMGGIDFGYRWEVGFDAGNGTTTLENWKQQKNSESVVLPEAKAQFEGWRFFGWSKTPVENVKTRPADLLPAGTIYTPDADVKLYAIYGVGHDGPLVDEYVLTDNVEKGEKYMLVSKNAESTVDIIAISVNALTAGSTVKAPVGTVVEVDFDRVNPTITAPTADLLWEVASVDEENFTLKNGSNYLGVVSGGFSLNDVPANLSWDVTYGLYGLSPTGSRYYVHNSSGKFSVSTTKTKGSRVYLYGLTDFSDQDVTYTSYPLDLTEGIAGITAPSVSSVIYDLQGRLSNGTNHGVFIQGGRKVIR